jgi:hypothetical protein
VQQASIKTASRKHQKSIKKEREPDSAKALEGDQGDIYRMLATPCANESSVSGVSEEEVERLVQVNRRQSSP